EHLGRDDHGLRRDPASTHQLLLSAGNIFVRDLDPEITASNHDCIGEANDVLDLIEGRGLLDLRHEPGPITDQSARLDHVAWLLHEGQGDPIDAESQSEGEVGAILRGQRRKVQNRIGKVDSLAVRDHASHNNLGFDVVVSETGHAYPDAAVIDQEIMSRGDGGEDFRMGRGIEVLPPSVPDSTNRIVSPASTAILPSRIVPTRILGPWRSCRMPIGRPISFSSTRMARWTLA